jgi:hypothetical protein
VLLVRETEPPKTFGDFDDVVIKYKFSQVSVEKLKPLFDEDQWQKVSMALDGFREFGPFLKRHGLLPNEPVANVPVPFNGQVSKEFKPRKRSETISE